MGTAAAVAEVDGDVEGEQSGDEVRLRESRGQVAPDRGQGAHARARRDGGRHGQGALRARRRPAFHPSQGGERSHRAVADLVVLRDAVQADQVRAAWVRPGPHATSDRSRRR